VADIRYEHNEVTAYGVNVNGETADFGRQRGKVPASDIQYTQGESRKEGHRAKIPFGSILT
jgi:hypothetical protein